MKDLTKIKTPFGLLKPKVRKAIKEHFKNGGEIEWYLTHEGWCDIPNPHWDKAVSYRVKPNAKSVMGVTGDFENLWKPTDTQEFSCENLINLSGVVASQREHLEVIAAAPAIFAAVKEWQVSMVGGGDRHRDACNALRNIKVPA